MMSADDALQVLAMLDAAGVPAWVDGGWGIDALVGEQSRPPDDLDLVVPADYVPVIRESLRALGHSVTSDGLPTRLPLADATGRQVDQHPVTLDAGGDGVQQLQDGSTFRYSPDGFAGSGQVAGHAVRCLIAATQMRCHLGYPPDASDRHDVLLLHRHCGIPLPAAHTSSGAG